MDEISLWSIALSAQEIACMYNNGIDPANPGLELYYNCNQGVAGGNNSSITSLLNQAGSTNGTLNGFGMNGPASNFVAGIASYATQDSATICSGYSYQFGSQTLTSAGVYTEAFVSSNGCDSLVELTLDLYAVDTSVTENISFLSANQAGASYQWVICPSYTPLAGDTLQTFYPPVNGAYAVIVTYNGCTDTSYCFTYLGLGLNEDSAPALLIASPNPVQDELSLMLAEDGDVWITDAAGRRLMAEKGLRKGTVRIDTSLLAHGIYFVSYMSGGSSASLRFVKN
jgi:hypothetical protein